MEELEFEGEVCDDQEAWFKVCCVTVSFWSWYPFFWVAWNDLEGKPPFSRSPSLDAYPSHSLRPACVMGTCLSCARLQRILPRSRHDGVSVPVSVWCGYAKIPLQWIASRECSSPSIVIVIKCLEERNAQLGYLGGLKDLLDLSRLRLSYFCGVRSIPPE